MKHIAKKKVPPPCISSKSSSQHPPKSSFLELSFRISSRMTCCESLQKFKLENKVDALFGKVGRKIFAHLPNLCYKDLHCIQWHQPPQGVYSRPWASSSSKLPLFLKKLSLLPIFHFLLVKQNEISLSSIK